MLKDWSIMSSEEVEHQQVLVCDKAFARFVDGEPPSVRRNTYKKPGPMCLIYSGFGGDKRGPMIMKGARHACFRKYSGSWGTNNSSPTHWGREIIGRYLRRIRYTCFDYSESVDFVRGLMTRVQDKIGGMTRDEPCNVVPLAMMFYRSDRDGYDIWFNGKHLYGLTKHQYTYIRKMYGIAEKIRKVA